MTTEEYIHRSAGRVADAFSLCDRGYIAVGRIADVSVIDLENFRPVADFQRPTELSTGIVHMLVNGVAVIRGGEYTGALPGNVVNLREVECGD